MPARTVTRCPIRVLRGLEGVARGCSRKLREKEESRGPEAWEEQGLLRQVGRSSAHAIGSRQATNM